MATAPQVKALLQSHGSGDEERFFAIALDAAAAEALRGHDVLAQEIRKLVDQAKARTIFCKITACRVKNSPVVRSRPVRYER